MYTVKRKVMASIDGRMEIPIVEPLWKVASKAKVSGRNPVLKNKQTIMKETTMTITSTVSVSSNGRQGATIKVSTKMMLSRGTE